MIIHDFEDLERQHSIVNVDGPALFDDLSDVLIVDVPTLWSAEFEGPVR